MNLFFIGMAMLAGVTIPLQSAANAQLNKGLGQVSIAALAIYVVALCGLLLCAPFMGMSLTGFGMRAATIPWWAWAGGICNLLFVLAAALTTQRLGAAAFTVTIATTGTLVSIVLDNFGWFGLAQHPVSWLRAAGAVLAIGGVVLVSLF